MRPWMITVPAGLALVAGGWAFLLSGRPHFSGLADYQPRHFITGPMSIAAQEAKGEKVPLFNRTAVDGTQVDLAQMLKKGPVYLYFIMRGCPCSIEFQPFVQNLYSAYGGKVQFVGVTDGTPEQAKAFIKEFHPTFPIISEPSKKLMKEFKAQESTYSVLVAQNGRTAKMWPGWDQEMLTEMQQKISILTGLDNPGMNVSQAPLTPTSGCFFYGQPQNDVKAS